MAETNSSNSTIETEAPQGPSPSSPPPGTVGVVTSASSTAAELVTPTPATSSPPPNQPSEAKSSLFKSPEAPTTTAAKVEAVTPDASQSSSTAAAAVKTEAKKVYREEVLGRYVLIEFLIDVNRRAWFRGQILKYQLSWSPNNNPNKIEHFVRFDDGDERWFALVVEEEMGRLQWTTGSSSSSADTLPARKCSNNSKRPSTTFTSIERKRPKVEPASDESVGVSEDEEEDEEDDVDEDEEEVLPYEERVALLSKEAESEWMDDMRNWLEAVPHGRVKKVVSPSNASKVMSQVSKLVAGKGITYKNWPSSVCFYGGVRINLSYDFDKLLKVAKDFEVMYGEDKGHGWLLRHPIQKMGLYKEYRLNCEN